MFPDSHQVDLEFQFSFEDLYREEGLVRLYATFLKSCSVLTPPCSSVGQTPGANPTAFDRKQRSEPIVELALHLEDFVGQLFGIGSEVNEIKVPAQRV